MLPNQNQCLIHYNDVVQTNNMCQTNWFDMYLTMLIVVDNNTKNRLVAQCLSEDETVESYKWFLDCILHATDYISPICLFSDADLALMKVIASKIPNIHHF